MALNEEMLDAIESVIRTDEDAEAFEQGYLLGLDATRNVRFEGQALPQDFGGFRLRFRVEKSEVGSDKDSKDYTPGFSTDPAFVLGAAIAGCKLKQEGHVQ